MANKSSSPHDLENGEKERSRDDFENDLLRARARGEISSDASFDRLYREYRGTVSGWLSYRVDRGFVDDLAQDVWLIFYSRWQRWEFGVEAESIEAHPVLSFLFRTCHFVVLGHRRLAANRLTVPQEEPDALEHSSGPRDLSRSIEARQCLEIAHRECSEEELDVLLAKLTGLSAREIASALQITEAVVDHRYRNAISRTRKKMRLSRKGVKK